MKFEKWFTAQFGPRPSEKSTVELIDEVTNKQYAAEIARAELHACELWERSWQSAHYAWLILDRDKKHAG